MLFVPSIPFAGSGTWANRPAAVPAAGTFYFATDLGEYGTLLQSTGTRWRAVNGAASLKTLGAPVSGIAGSETIVLQALLPINSLQINDTLRIWLATSKSGATDSCILNVRVGTAGTVADTALTGLNAFGLMAAGGLSGGGMFDIKLLTATSAQRLGASASNLASYTSPNSTSAAAAATAITDASANALFVTVTLRSSAATDTVGLASGSIQLITP